MNFKKKKDMNVVICGCPYVTEVLLVHLDLFNIRSVIGCVDLVLLLVVSLTIQTLEEQETHAQHCFNIHHKEMKH